jgi:hypothetical protein
LLAEPQLTGDGVEVTLSAEDADEKKLLLHVLREEVCDSVNPYLLQVEWLRVHSLHGLSSAAE